MTSQPEIHILTAGEIEQIKSLGFQFRGIQYGHEQFVNIRFPNFNLLAFLLEIDTILHPLTNAVVFKYVDLKATTPPEIHIQYYTEDYDDESNGLALSRVFTWQKGEIVVKHSYFMLPVSARGAGIAKKVFRASLQQYVNMGVRKILVHAALQDGGYAWARNFFTATNRSEVDDILFDADRRLTYAQFRAVERIYTNCYSKYPAGDAFPIVKWAEMSFMKDILRGSSWHGQIDFNNQEQLSNFISYVFQ